MLQGSTNRFTNNCHDVGILEIFIAYSAKKCGSSYCHKKFTFFINTLPLTGNKNVVLYIFHCPLFCVSFV